MQPHHVVLPLESQKEMDAASACGLGLLWRLVALLSLPLIVGAGYSNDPSTNWTLSSYYYHNASDYTDFFWYYRYSNFTACNNGSSYLESLDQEAGLYGRILETDGYMNLYSAHVFLPYTLYFALYFVITADKVCMKGNDSSSIPAYYLSMVALNEYGRRQDPRKGQIVWTANPDKPVSNYACLHLNDSDLTLVDYHDSIGSSSDVIWHINTSASSVSLTISYEGNLVLFSNTTDPPYEPLWESLQYPSDTLMVLQVLDSNRTLTVNSTATSNSGNYTLAIEHGRLVLYARIGPLTDHGDSPYGSPYWVWPSSNSYLYANANISFAAFCWDPVNQLRLYAGSNRSMTNEDSRETGSSDNYTEYRGTVSPQFCSTIPNNSDTTISITGLNHSANATYATFLRLEADGDLRAYTVVNTTYPGSNAIWRPFYNVFNTTPCDLPLYCGSYGMCDPQRRGGSCECNYSVDSALSMVFSDKSNPKSGCEFENGMDIKLWDVRNISSSGPGSTCPTTDNMAACTAKHSACEVDLFRVDNVHYFSVNFTKSYEEVNSSDGCKQACHKDCSCTAAFWDGTNNRCFLVLGSLGTIQKQLGSMQAFIKYMKITPTHSIPWKIIAPILAFTILLASILLSYCLRRRAQKKSELQKERLLLLSLLDCGDTQRFTWKQMHEYTCGFSDLLGGGGFGHVFRGSLPDGTAIAVKKLDEGGSQGQGNKEFIAEVSILTRIHHANLVHLIGFCLEGNHKLLVYEYMENGSLDAWLFKSNSTPPVQEVFHHGLRHGNLNEKDKGKKRLPWKARFQIAMGTAKGLAYLHEECEERVMHLDLKPQNILLSRNFLAKISDFGMSTRTARDQTSVMTVMRGTPGYLAPEWLLDCAITEKCDVYSFGIVLLEMVSGKKLKDLSAVKQKLRMRPLRESVMLDLLDESLRYERYVSDVDEMEAVSMVKVALMCVRTDPTKRPAMSSVALMLEGKEEVVQEVLDDAFDAKQELVMYPSTMHRDMRTQHRPEQGVQGMYDSSFRSFTDYSSSNMWWNSDDNNNYSSSSQQKQKMHNTSYNKYYFNMDHHQLKAKAASFFQRKDTMSSSSPSSAGEWEHLLREQPRLA